MPKNPTFKMEKVKSSNIEEVGYDEPTKILRVTFYNGSIYQFHPITQQGYVALKTAESVGSYFYKHVRNNDLVTTTQIK